MQVVFVKRYQTKSCDGQESTSSSPHKSTVYQRPQNQTWHIFETGYEHLKQPPLCSSTYKYKYK